MAVAGALRLVADLYDLAADEGCDGSVALSFAVEGHNLLEALIPVAHTIPDCIDGEDE